MKVSAQYNTPAAAARRLGYSLGATYLDKYWREQHTIIAAGVDAGGYPWVTSRWADGHETTHATPLERGDRLVSEI